MTRDDLGLHLPNQEGSKFCAKCKETKPRTDFSKDSSRTDGLQAYCKVCKSGADKKAKLNSTEELSLTQQRNRRRIFELEWYRQNAANLRPDLIAALGADPEFDAEWIASNKPEPKPWPKDQSLEELVAILNANGRVDSKDTGDGSS